MIEKTILLTNGLHDNSIKFVGKCPKCGDYVFERGNAWICMSVIANLCNFKVKNSFNGKKAFPRNSERIFTQKNIQEKSISNNCNTSSKHSKEVYNKKYLKDFNTDPLIEKPSDDSDEEYFMYYNLVSNQK